MSEPASRFGDSLTQFSRELNEFTPEPTDPIDQTERSAAERALKAQMAGVVRNLFGGSDADVLQAVLEELRELNRTQRRVLELLARWDAEGRPPTRGGVE